MDDLRDIGSHPAARPSAANHVAARTCATGLKLWIKDHVNITPASDTKFRWERTLHAAISIDARQCSATKPYNSRA